MPGSEDQEGGQSHEARGDQHAGSRFSARGGPFVVVVGYYARSGFEPASRRGLASQWEGIPDAAFLVLVLDETAMAGASGVARYRAEFDAVA